MPRPYLNIDDPKSIESQAVPLRLAYLISGQDFDSFMRMFYSPIDDYTGPLRGYVYIPGENPREVRKVSYKNLHELTYGYSTLGDRLRMLPANHFVWCVDLDHAATSWMEPDFYPYNEPDWVNPLSWNPPLNGMDALIDECVDLSGLGDPSEYPEQLNYADDATFLVRPYLFRHYNDGFWVLIFNRCRCGPFSDSKGLRYLKHLLREQGKTLSAIALTALVNQPPVSPEQEVARSMLTSQDEDHEDDAESMQVTDGGDAGEAIDEQARDAYRKQIQTLRDQLDEAQEFGEVEKAEKILFEIDALTRELRVSTRPDGRPRREKATVKRAYDTVSKAIKKATADLTEQCPELGRHLDESIQYRQRQGWIYQPSERIDWRF